MLVAVVHHIAGDGWSVAPLARDVSVAYAARLCGAGAGWAPLPVQYADYALWQRELLGDQADPDSRDRRAGGVLASRRWRGCRSSWRCRLTGRARRWPTIAGPAWRSAWPAQLQRRLAEVARSRVRRCSWWCRLRLAVLLSRLGAGTDMPVGFTGCGRGGPRRSTSLVGFFVNTLVLRTDLSGDPTVAELLARVRQRGLAAYEHQDVPFERLVERLNPARSLARHPLFR